MNIVTSSRRIEADFISGYTWMETPREEEWQSHWISNWSLLLTLEGRGEIRLRDETIRPEKGELTLIAPNLPHRFRVSGIWNLLWVHFLMRPHVAAEFSWPETSPGLYRTTLAGRDFRRAWSALLEAHRLDLNRERYWRQLAYTLLEETLVRGSRAAGNPGRDRDSILESAQRRLLDFTRNPGIDRIAAECGMSRASFYAHFKRRVGISPREYRELNALRHAQLLLESTSLPVAEIARQCGMDNAFYFSNRFRKCYGLSPSAYREEHFAARK